MKRLTLSAIFTIAAAALMVAGTAFPLWIRNGIAVTGWEGDYLSVGRWVVVIVGAGALTTMIFTRLRKPQWLSLLGFIGLVQALLVLWKGYKLHAIGYGAWMLLAGALTLLIGAWLMQRENHRSAPPSQG